MPQRQRDGVHECLIAVMTDIAVTTAIIATLCTIFRIEAYEYTSHAQGLLSCSVPINQRPRLPQLYLMTVHWRKNMSYVPGLLSRRKF